jgi:hypothetical protein
VRLVLTSLAFIAVAALNQLAGPALHALGLSYPRWAFWLLVAAPFGVLPPIGRRLVAGMGTAAARGRPARGAAAPRAGVAAPGAA